MFRERLVELMSEKKIKNYTELASKTQIPSSTIYSWKTSLPNGDNLITLANFFEVSIDYLVGRADETGLIKSNAQLSELENNFITLLRKMPPIEQARIYGMVRAYIG